jgi:hypothetical protein
MTMNNLYFLFCLSFLLYSLPADAQDSTATFSIAINQDNAFGFAPAVYGSFGTRTSIDFTYYGIFWTNHAFSNNGFDNWLETGIGVGIPVFNGHLYCNPSLGFTHGSLLSGEAEGRFAEGIVPNLAAFFDDGRFEGELYFGYYKALKEGDNYADYILYWVYPGIKINERFSAGAHYEQFYLANNFDGFSESLYQWLGAYLKLNAGGRHSYRFSAGANLVEGSQYANSFYKLSISLSLL